jgi:hypothetical protein
VDAGAETETCVSHESNPFPSCHWSAGVAAS